MFMEHANPPKEPTMRNPSQAFAARLRHHAVLRLERPRQLCLRAERGTLWVTIDGQADDIVLQAGERVVLDGEVRVMVTPLGGDAAYSATPLPRPPRWGERLVQALAGAPLSRVWA
jgi:Protein of unknown function (DUF2917)